MIFFFRTVHYFNNLIFDDIVDVGMYISIVTK